MEYRNLHDRLLAARNGILAHSDLALKEARVDVARTTTGKFVGVVQNVLTGTEEFSSLDGVIDLIEATLRGLYVDVKQLERQLPPNT